MKFLLKELTKDDHEEWKTLLNGSEDGTFFHKTEFLDAFNVQYRLFIVFKGTQSKAGIVCLIRNDDLRSMIPYDGVIHDGIFFKKNFVDSLASSKRNSAKFEIVEFILEEFVKIFDDIEFSLVPEHIDIRAFSWVNYHSENPTDKFHIEVRYTSLLNIKGINDTLELDKNNLFKGLSNSRRQEIRYAIKYNASFIQSDNMETFFDLYAKMAVRYDENVHVFVDKLRKLAVVAKPFLRVYYVQDQGGEVSAAAVFSVYNGKACYLYGVTSKDNRESYSGSYILWEAFKAIEKEGVEIVDLEGVNSPQRGWFKLSFGGELVPYYQTKKKSSTK